MLARVRTLYFGDRLAAFKKDWALQLAYDDPQKRKPFLARYIARMWSASEFINAIGSDPFGGVGSGGVSGIML